MKRMTRIGATLVAAGLTLAACGGGGSDESASNDTVTVGIVTSLSGALGAEGNAQLTGIKAAVDHLTNGTNEINGHKIKLVVEDDTSDPAVATTKAKTVLGNGATILAGTASSASATSVAGLAIENDALLISGLAAATDLVGMDKNVFMASKFTPSGVQIMKQIIGDASGKTIGVVAPDYAFGQGFVKDLTKMVAADGGKVEPYLLPQTTTDFSTVALELKRNKPDFFTTPWVGPGTEQLWNTLASQGVTSTSKAFTQLGMKQNWAPVANAVGSALPDTLFYIDYYPGVTGNDADKAIQAYGEKNDEPVDYTSGIGWNVGAMIVQAVKGGGDDTAKMSDALEGYTVAGPSGDSTVRAEDHQFIPPIPTFYLKKAADGSFEPTGLKIVPAADLVPPIVRPIK